MRRFILLALATVGAACGRDADYGGSARLAAVAAGDTLTADQLAKFMQRSDPKIRSRALADLVVQAWVDCTLLARATTAGTDLTGDAIVESSLGPARGAALTRQWHLKLDRKRPPATDAEIAAAYASDSMRVFDYLRWTIDTAGGRAAIELARARADSARRRVVAGTRFIDVLTALKRRGTIADGGTILVTSRGQSLPGFNSAAWTLDPGDVAAPSLTRAAIQVTRRPPLGEVRPQVAQHARALNSMRLDALFVDSIATVNKLVVPNSAVPALRRYLVGLATDTPAVTAATWTAGSLTVGQLGPWFGALPPAIARGLYRQSDNGLSSLVRRIARNVVLERTAAAQGIVAPADTIRLIVARFRTDLAKARAVAGLDDRQLTDTTKSVAARMVLSRRLIDAYLDGVVRQSVQFAPLPAGLPTVLRAHLGFRLHPAGIAEAVTRATTPWGSAGVVADSGRNIPGIRPDP